MPLFRYKAVTAAGEVIEGDMEASSQSVVNERLHQLGHVPIRADPVAEPAAESWLSRDLFGARGPSGREIGLITRELSSLIGAGLTLEHSFQILIELAERKSVAQLLARVLEALRGGDSLADGLAAQGAVFPNFYVSMVRAGERGGTLDEVLARLADFLETQQVVRAKIRSALIYPMILLLMAGASIAILMTVVIPEFKPLFEDAGQALPLSTRIVMASAEAFGQTWWMLLIVAAGLVLSIRRGLADPGFRLRWDSMKLGLPLFGDLVRKLEIARFTRTLGTLLKNGVPLLNGLVLVRESIDNAVLGTAIEEVAARLKEGEKLADQLSISGEVPKLATQLVRVGEESGQLDSMLIKTAEIYDREVQEKVERLLALLVPVLTIALGMLIAVIIGSILSAFLSINDLALQAPLG